MGVNFELMGILRLYDHPNVWHVLAKLEKMLQMQGGARALSLLPIEPDELKVTIDFSETCSPQTVDGIQALLLQLTPLLLVPVRLCTRTDGDILPLYLGRKEQIARLKSEEAVNTIMGVLDDLLPEDRVKAAETLLQHQG